MARKEVQNYHVLLLNCNKVVTILQSRHVRLDFGEDYSTVQLLHTIVNDAKVNDPLCGANALRSEFSDVKQEIEQEQEKKQIIQVPLPFRRG